MSQSPQVYYLSERDMAQAMEWLLITARRARDADGRRAMAPIPMGAPEPLVPGLDLMVEFEDGDKVREAVLTALHSLTGQPWQVRRD